MLPAALLVLLCATLAPSHPDPISSVGTQRADQQRADGDDAQMPGMEAPKRAPGADGDRWMLMMDGSFTLMVNRQGGPAGETQVRAPNWWMGMATHRLGPGTFSGNLMLSLDPATVGKCGYGELFQVGETCHGRPLADRQHPHDLTGQFAAAWRLPLSDRTSITFAGGPVGEPALGPVAYMHRPSAGANPVAPLSHHTFDSTHIAMGVATVAVQRTPFAVEGSVFNAREPNENRWNVMDPGAWDSWSARLWFLPSPGWQIQVSTGRLVSPEALEPGNIQRTTASVSWLRDRAETYSAVTGGYGRNDKSHDTLEAMFLEGSHQWTRTEVYARFEALQVETNILATGEVPGADHALPIQTVVAASGGVARQVARLRGFELSAGGDITVYRVPPVLVASHGGHPVSAHVFLRLRPPAPMGRMWNMTMTGLLTSHHRMDTMPGM